MTRPVRPASTVCLLRDTPGGLDGFDVLMVQRGHSARFMGGAWVFPGGVVDEIDGDSPARSAVVGAPGEHELPWMAAGLRELAEEVRIWLTDQPLAHTPGGRPFGGDVYETLERMGVRFDAGRLAYFANWITPSMIPMRFDTRFYAAIADLETVADPDPGELATAEWIRPQQAIDLADTGEWTIPFPTVNTLEFLSGFSTASEIIDHARELAEVEPIVPRGRVTDGGEIEVVVPGEDGYEELADALPDADALKKAARAAGRGQLVEFDDGER